MDKDCAAMVEAMEQQMVIYRELLKLESEKQKVLVKGDISELERITRLEEAFILQVGRLEEERRKVHLALANRFSLSVDDLTLSEIAKRTDEETSAQCRQVFQDMTGVLRELGEKNDTNSQLIKSSLDFIDFSVNLVTGAKAVGYGKDENRPPEPAKIFDRKI